MPLHASHAHTYVVIQQSPRGRRSLCVVLSRTYTFVFVLSSGRVHRSLIIAHRHLHLSTLLFYWARSYPRFSCNFFPFLHRPHIPSSVHTLTIFLSTRTCMIYYTLVLVILTNADVPSCSISILIYGSFSCILLSFDFGPTCECRSSQPFAGLESVSLDSYGRKRCTQCLVRQPVGSWAVGMMNDGPPWRSWGSGTAARPARRRLAEGDALGLECNLS